jgi:phytoene synthase
MTMTLTATAAPDDARATAQANALAASGSSFYAGMRVLPRAEREAMYAVYGFCRIVDDIADDQTRPIPEQARELDAWRADVEALYAGKAPGRAVMLAAAVARYGLEKADFLAVIDGMQMDLEGIVRPDLATLFLYCERVAVAVGRLSVKVFGMPAAEGEALAQHLGLALQLTNVLRDVDEDAAMGRLYLPDELLAEAGIAGRDPHATIAAPGVDQVCRALCATALEHFAQADAIMAAKPPGRLAAPRLMSAAYSDVLRRMQARGWAPPRTRVRTNKVGLLWLLIRQGLFG